MKKLSYIVLLLLTHNSFAQDSTAYQKLQQQFDHAFIELEKKSPDETYYNHLVQASNFLLRMDDPFFRGAYKEAVTTYADKDVKWRIRKLADSLIYTTITRQLWSGLETEFNKYNKLLDLYNSAFCNCFTDKFKSETDYRNLLILYQDCEKQLLLDKSLMNRMAVNMASLSMAERLQLPKYASRYSYQNCPSLFAALNDGIIGGILENYYQDTYLITSSLHETVVRLYTQQKKDSLALLFPTYQTAQKHLEKAADLMGKAPSALWDRKGDESKLVTVIKTLISSYEKPQLLGQVIYSYSFNDFKVQVHSFKFLSADQIPNKNKLLKELNDLPIPPEIEKLENTRIN